MSDSPPKLALVFTGGTISMALDPQTGAAKPALTGAEILARIPGGLEGVEFEVEEFGKYPGPHMDPDRMLDAARRVGSLLERDDIAGAVVTHGTDTLEETAYLFDLILPGRRPAVFTGAMKTSSEPNWDGPANLVAACKVAADPTSAGRGTLVVLDDAIHAAAQVTKGDTEAFGSFKSPRSGPLGRVDRGKVSYLTAPERPARLPMPDRLEGRIDLVAAGAGADDRLLRASIDSGARGLVLQALGRGNVPPAMLPGVRHALDAGLPVVVTSRCATGRVAPRYGYAGGGAVLEEMGCILAGDLPAVKARIRLMVLLAGDADAAALRTAF